MLKYLFILLLTLLSFGCGSGIIAGGADRPGCPDPPSVAWMVPKIEGQPDQLSDRRTSVQGRYAPKAEVIGPRYGRDCWTTAGLPLHTLTEAVSTALAHVGPVQFAASPEGGIYVLQFEVEWQSLTYTFHSLGLGNCTATVVVSYSVSVSDRKAPIWKEKITGEHTIEYGSAAAPRNYGSRSKETAAIEGAVATNLRVLIRKLKDLPLDKD